MFKQYKELLKPMMHFQREILVSDKSREEQQNGHRTLKETNLNCTVPIMLHL